MGSSRLICNATSRIRKKLPPSQGNHQVLDSINLTITCFISKFPKNLSTFAVSTLHLFVGLVTSLFLQGLASAQTFNLAQLIQIATDTHPAVRSQLSSEKSAQFGIETAVYQTYPTPQLTYESVKKNSSDTSYAGSDAVATIRITQPIFNGGQYDAQLDKAKANLQVSQANVRESRRQVAIRVVQAYAEWVSAELKVQAIDKSMAVHQKLVQQAKNRIAQGASPASDLSLVQGRLDATSGELFSAKLQAELALQKLGELTGVSVNAAQLKADMSGPITHTLLIDNLLANAQIHSPELQKAKAQALISRANVQEKQAALKPDIYLRAERQYGNYFSASDTGAHNRIFIGVTSKFGPGLSSFSQISAAKTQEDSSEFDIQFQQKLLREQVLNDVTVLRSLQKKMQALQGALQASLLVLESFERQFNAGRKTWLDLMTVVRDVAQNETQLADMRGSELQTSWHLQILTSDNYTQVNSKP